MPSTPPRTPVPGTVAEATHPVVALAARPDPTWVRLPDGSSWTERLCALTGWQPVARRPAVDVGCDFPPSHVLDEHFFESWER